MADFGGGNLLKSVAQHKHWVFSLARIFWPPNLCGVGKRTECGPCWWAQTAKNQPCKHFLMKTEWHSKSTHLLWGKQGNLLLKNSSGWCFWKLFWQLNETRIPNPPHKYLLAKTGCRWEKHPSQAPRGSAAARWEAITQIHSSDRLS